jgi:hypothetical protein
MSGSSKPGMHAKERTKRVSKRLPLFPRDCKGQRKGGNGTEMRNNRIEGKGLRAAFGFTAYLLKRVLAGRYRSVQMTKIAYT